MNIKMPKDWLLIAKDTVGSTNEEAKRLAMHKASEGVVVLAKEQTAGHGRRSRNWYSPRGNLFCSIILKPEKLLSESSQVSFVATVALVEALDKLCGLKACCKWPNDVLINDKKLSGLLLEVSGEEQNVIILGLGVNVSKSPDKEVLYPATSLKKEGVDVSVESMLEAFLFSFNSWYEIWKKEGFEKVGKAWLSNAKGVGEKITVRLPATTFQGIFKGLDKDGALLLETPDGKTKKITAGDVFFTPLSFSAQRAGNP